MTILDRARGTRRLRIDPRQFADDLAKHLPDLDQVDLGKARDAAGDSIADATRGLRKDVEKAGDTIADANPFDDLGQRLRAFSANGGLPGLLSRVERELPDTDKDRYTRAFERGRIQTRTKYLVVGTITGIAAGALAFVFLDPDRGKARREAMAKRLSDATSQVKERAQAIATERGIVKPDPGPVGVMDAPIGAPAWPAAEGPLDQPLESPDFGAHEALPDELVGAGHLTDAGDPAESTPRA